MPCRFQFSLSRLLACTSALCIAVAAVTNGLAEARRSKSGIPILVGWMVAWLMAGAGVGYLLNNRVVAILGTSAAFAMLVVLGFLLAR